MALKKLGALWQGKTKAGDIYLNGSIEIGDRKIRVACFSVKKTSEKSPDWQVYEFEKDQR